MNTTVPASSERPPLKARLQHIALLFFAGLSVILIIWIAVSGMISNARHEEELGKVREASARQLDGRTRLLLHALAAALQPGVAEALRSGDDARLRTHVQALAGKRDVRLVIVADEQGTVRASTDSRLTGSQLQQTFQLLAGGISEISVDTTSSALYRLLIPLTRGGARIGTAIVECDFTGQ